MVSPKNARLLAALAPIIAIGLLAAYFVRTPGKPAGTSPSAAAKEPGGSACATPPSKAIDDSIRQKDSLLTKEERQRIWDVEHAAFILNHKAFPAVAKRLIQGQYESLAELFQPGFTGEALELPKLGPDPDFPYIQTAAATSEKGHLKSLPTQQFVPYLARYTALFTRTAYIKFKVKSFKPRVDADGREVADLYVRLTLFSEMPESRLLMLESHHAITVAKVTEDYPVRKAWILDWKVRNVDIQSTKRDLFEDVTEASGMGALECHDNWTDKRPKGARKKVDISGGVYLADYNRDGWLDVLITDVNGVYLMQGNSTGRFKLDRKLEIRSPSGLSAIWGDFNNDGWVDLFLGQRLYLNYEGVLTPTDTQLYKSPYAAHKQLSVADYDNDGNLDVYALNAGKLSPRITGNGTRGFIDQEQMSFAENALWKNKGDGKFEDVTYHARARGKFAKSFAANWIHADDDMYPELIAVSEFGRNVFLANNGDGTFTPENVDPNWGGFSMGVSSGDIDNDGKTDIYMAAMYSSAGSRILEHINVQRYPPGIRDAMPHLTEGNYLYRGLGQHRFEEVAHKVHAYEAGWAYGGNLLDMNNDGYLDIYAPAGHHSVSPDAADG